MTILEPLGGDLTQPRAIGYAWDISNADDTIGILEPRAVRWRGGRTVDLPVPGRHTYARRINERGDVAAVGNLR
jgi:hypothetical protein